MRIQLSYPDQAYIVVQETKSTHHACDICDGAGKVLLKDKKFTCPECNGHGGKTDYVTTYGVNGPARLKKVSVDRNGNAVIDYEVVSRTMYNNEYVHTISVRPENVFETEDDANYIAKSRTRMMKAVGL